MTYQVAKLISEAFYTSGIVSREFQQVAGDQSETGFDKLNEILTDTTVEDDMIPYYTTAYDFNLVAGQEKYFIPKLTKLETFTFFINSVRYSTYFKSKDRYFGSARAQNINSLPFNWNAERTNGGMNLFLYFFPQLNYPAEITGWFTLDPVQTVDQDLMSPVTFANLGAYLFERLPPALPALTAGQLVINGFDLVGTYAQVSNLITAINTNIPFVSASLQGPQLVLVSHAGINITVTTVGSQQLPNAISFTNFSTMNGPLNQVFMPQVWDQFYINYLIYRLADRLCTAYNFKVPENVKKQLLQYKQMISDKSSPMDLNIMKVSTLSRQNAINYAQVNLGRGWTV